MIMKSPLRPATQGPPSAPVLDKLRTAIGYLRRELDETRLRMSGLEDSVSDLEVLLASLPDPSARSPADADRLGRRPAATEYSANRPDKLLAANARTEAQARGEAFLASLVEDGTLISSEALATRWCVTKQALHLAVRRGDLFSVKVAGKRLYPSVFQHLEREPVADVCRVLKPLSASEQLVFWLRKHGGLRGMTVAEALEAGMRKRVLEVAAGWAEEKALADADS